MRIAVCGLGKAGKQVINEIYRAEDMELSCVFCRPGSEKAHKTLSDILPGSALNAPIYPTTEAAQAFAAQQTDALIDFSGKTAVRQLIGPCLDAGVNLITGTTGFSEKELTQYRAEVEKRKTNAMLCAPNITLGVNIMMYLSTLAAACLPNHDFVITEKHYSRKADVSGTAKRLQGRMSRLLAREVPLNVVRAGGYIGLHEVLCAGENERITIIHESFSRSAFAQGALLAVKHLSGKTGWFDMDDVVLRYIREKEASLLSVSAPE